MARFNQDFNAYEELDVLIKKTFLGFLALLFIGVGGFYVTNQPDLQVAELKPQPYSDEIKAFLDRHLQNDIYTGTGGTNNYYERFSNPNGSIDNPLIILTGLEDITENWWPTVQQAFQWGFKTVYVHELRGQGRSSRNNNQGIIDLPRFSEYNDDFLLFLKHIDGKFGHNKAPPFIIGHSTSGLVVAAALKQVQEKMPDYMPERVVLFGPLFKLNVSPILKNIFVSGLIDTFERVARSVGWIMLGKKFVDRPFEENRVTHNREFYEKSVKIRATHGLRSSGVSIRWALGVQNQIFFQNKRGFQWLSEQPTLVLLADKEVVVDNSWKIRSDNIKIVTIPDSKHALHMETPTVFKNVMKKTFDFFLQH